MADAVPSLADALAPVDLSAPSTSALNPLRRWAAEKLEYAEPLVYAISVSRSGNLKKQAGQSERGLAAKVLVVVHRDDGLVESTVAQAPNLIGPGRFDGVLVVVTEPAPPRLSAIVQPVGGQLYARLASEFPGAVRHDVQPAYVAPGRSPPPGPVTPTALVPVGSSGRPLVLDPRIKRMLRLAIATSRAVMLVGPPGTGKTTLLEEALREVTDAPATYGLSAAPPGGMTIVTPEEGWTVRELAGGETVDDDGRLRFRPGHVLEAIRHDRWLVLDEANRADMDRIFGGLLTWLSLKPVTLGTASTALDAADVRLEWGDHPESRVDGYERLESGQGPVIRFIAGEDWRLLGTYNALDAQRVFRFGQALGRRFARVPVPAISPEEFVQALEPHLDALPEGGDASRLEFVLRGLYAAHLDTPPVLGPALFLAIPAYVANGLQLLGVEEVLADEDTTPAATDSLATRTAAAVDALLAEGYVLGAGAWLAQLDPEELDRLHARVVTDQQLLTEAQWAFLSELLPALA